MRIMATSDLHGNLDGLDPTGADVVVLAGDVAPLRGRGPRHINDQKKWINKRFREWTASYPDIQFFFPRFFFISQFPFLVFHNVVHHTSSHVGS